MCLASSGLGASAEILCVEGWGLVETCECREGTWLWLHETFSGEVEVEVKRKVYLVNIVVE